ncbi:hypothetical protein [Enhygromyxa salina]|uniref:WD domain, G-beta repeat n=1 Tax=Enhygromyxa salina TaxID=215803 RepID=A0A2S9YMP0_9BACT|nr:hypothetical protein [Enhygromyxa salina]PRQ06336.1 hypothetical protein ENSA7_40130 [Enhygromyxa salina]
MTTQLRHLWISMSALLLIVGACHKGADTSAVQLESGDQAAQLDASEAQVATPRDRSVSVARGPGLMPHEVELDPRARAALTIDVHGGVSLWPAIRSADPAVAMPYLLPMQEPLWMSLAQAEDGSFVVALIDTANAGQIVRVTPSQDGSEAELTPLFAIGPDDPLLELHALDGGERVLALGVDHRVRLYDAKTGALLSAIDERSFGPWQLRVVQGEPGQPPQIAAILAQPVRVQALELRDDRLSIASEARAVALDRGPNRNDLLLSPDGQVMAALRRPKAKGREFSIELIELRTGDRQLIGGKTDSTLRTRMHFPEAGRILLETGSSSGRALWVELAKAVPLTDPADADPGSQLADRQYNTKHDSIAVPASAERRPEYYEPEFDPPWDQGVRFHASVVAGVRVNIERSEGSGTALIVDPLDSDQHSAIRLPRVDAARGSLEHAGARLAVAGSRTLSVINLEDGAVILDEIEHRASSVVALAFADRDRVLLVDDKGRLALFEVASGTLVASTKLEFTWSINGVAYHADETGGVLGWRSGRPRDPERLLEIRDGQLGSVIELPRDKRPLWLETLDLSDAEAGALFGLSESEADDRVDEYTSARDGRLFYTEKSMRTPLVVRDGAEQTSFQLPAGQGRRLSVSPEGSKIAVVQFRNRDDGRSEDHLVSVLNTATGERLWTWGSDRGIRPFSWSGDGSRIAIGATVRDASTGEVIYSTPEIKLVIEPRDDGKFARYRDE